MSGLEVAGLVLGAIPIALEVLDRYKEVSRQLGFWRKISEKHKDCDATLKFHRLVYIENLRRLLLPMVLDDAQIDELISDPEAEAWRDAETAELLRKRLGDSYEIYIHCIRGFKATADAMNRELSAFGDNTQVDLNELESKTPQSRSGALKYKARWQMYRFRFSQREKEREELFADMKSYNDKLKAMLEINEDDAKLVRDRRLSKNGSASTAICMFWNQASKVFQAISAVWNCNCQTRHSTRLLLEHRTSGTSDLNLSFEQLLQPHLAAQMRRIRISSKGTGFSMQHDPFPPGPTSIFDLVGKMSLHEPKHRVSTPIKPGFWRKRPSRVGLGPDKTKRPSPSVTLTTFESSSKLTPGSPVTTIDNLCLSISHSDNSLCGILPEENSSYYVYMEPLVSSNPLQAITLEDILRKQKMPLPNRKQRLALAVVLASSFLQLLESPWLPSSWKKSDIVFFQDPDQLGRFKLHQPYLTHQLNTKSKTSYSTDMDRRLQLSSSLEMLAIILEELCFGQLLEDQPCRKKYLDAGDEAIIRIFDVAAAREWHAEIEEEAGYDYTIAVGWCLGGVLSIPPDRWREEMLTKVLQPLEACHKHLSHSVRA